MTAGTRNTKQTPSRSVRVVVVDDHALARAAVRTILGDDPLFEIVAEAADADGAFAAVQEHRPDLVLMDIRMPGGGLQATRRIKAAFPQVRIVMMTVSDAPQDLFEALRSGAQGYVLKNLETHQWTAYLRSVMDGATPISDSFAERIIHELTGTAALGAAVPERLTARETDVLRLVADGLTNREIAGRLGISQNTVKNHLKNIMAKVQADNRTQLVRLALELGMLS